ncbi:MAG: phosphodiester glycosidase family protein [Prolixibacteraceae bacterium]|jgi:exopolysaccharide biosynthesis protein|nr:phosphodiester glycosidase family protein [Prolixibacteraceae bacterium]
MTNGKHFKLLFFLVLFLFSACDASDHLPEKKPLTDAEKIDNIEWKVKEIREGIRLKTTTLNLFDSPQAIFMVEIDTAKADVNYHVGMPEVLATTSSQAVLQNAVVAINGSYFNMQQGYSRHFVKIDSAVLARTEENEFSTRATGVFKVTKNRIDIASWNKEKENQDAGNAEHAVVSGPLVIDDGNNMDMWNNAFVHDRHPRSFAAFSKGCLLLVAIDGRAPERAAGMSLTEVRIFARGLGCTDVINLDGGGSTTLYVKGEKGNGIVNVPSDGTERPVKSIVYVTAEGNGQ